MKWLEMRECRHADIMVDRQSFLSNVGAKSRTKLMNHDCHTVSSLLLVHLSSDEGV